MGIPALLRLKHKDIGALIVFCLIGWLIGSAVSDPIWGAYTAFLVCDHLFLGWLIFLRDNRVRRPIPIEVILLLHTAFVVLVVVVVAARNYLHYFGLFPFPMAALAFWLLSSAAGYEEASVVGYEENRPEPARVRRARATIRAADGQRLKKPAWTGSPTGAARSSTAIHLLQPEAAIPEPPIEVPQPAASSLQPATEPAPNFVQTQPAKGAAQPAKAIRQVLTVTELPISAYQPFASGVGLDLQTSMDRTRPAQLPVLCRDNSIAEDLRRRYPEDVARIYPILVATAEDNEAWLDARGKEDPTHRKLGMTVREEYEEWLEARVLARAAQNATSQGSPAPASYEGRDSQSQQLQA
ncbi:MAG: hypothetical protein WBE76_00010 [Terracidiphilus sp.]